MKLFNKSKIIFVALFFGILTQLHLVIPNYIKATTPVSKQVFDRNNVLLSLSLTTDDKFRIWTELKNISPEFIKLILEKEDKYFYSHLGVNPLSLLRATTNYIFHTGEAGASTISMQLARLYYQLGTSSIIGKVKQILLSFVLEFSLSKNEILECYLNLIPMGRNIEGIETAAIYYLAKSSRKLRRPELLFFSLLPQRPIRINLLLKKKLNKLSTLIRFTYPDFVRKDLIHYFSKLYINKKRVHFSPHFVRHMSRISDSNIIIKTTLDLKLQQSLTKILRTYVANLNSKGIFNAASIVIDSENGDILSYIGSADFFDKKIQGQVDGILAKRSPGSTLKPFIYALAFAQGLYIPKSIIYDSPLPYRTPENFDSIMNGPMTVENALITSRNIPAVAINAKLKRPDLYDLMQMIGMSAPHPKGYYGSSIALGAYEVSMLELAQMYSILAENGVFKSISGIKSITQDRAAVSVMTKESILLVKDILKKNPRPQYNKLSKFIKTNGNVYWKTGTSFGYKDAWAAGIWGKYVIISWLGDFKGKSNPFLVGSSAAGPLLFKIIDHLRHKQDNTKDYDLKHTYSSDISEVEVCTSSGKLPNKFCPHRTDALYIPGISPTTKCRIHRNIKVSVKNQLRACSEYQGKVFKQVYEFYSTEKIKIFKRYGLKLTLPPKFEEICKIKPQTYLLGNDPIIIYPKKGKIYLIEDKKLSIQLPLIVKTDTDVESVSWYVNGKLHIKTKPNQDSFLNLNSGEYILKAIDDKGRIDTRSVSIKNVAKGIVNF